MAFFGSSSSHHHVWETISVEFVGPFEKTPSGNRYVVVLTDLYSKWVEAKAIAEKTPLDVANFILSIFSRMGFCDCKFLNMDTKFEQEIRQSIHSLGSPFVKNLTKFKAILERFIEDKPCTDGEPRTDIKQYGYHTETLTSWIEEKAEKWDTHLEGFLFNLRMGNVNDDVENLSASPFSIIYGGPNPDSDKQVKVGGQRGFWKRGRGRPRRGRGRGGWTYVPAASVGISHDVNNSSQDETGELIDDVKVETADGTSVIKRRPGRPRKIFVKRFMNDEINEGDEGETQQELDSSEQIDDGEPNLLKRKRGRPRKNKDDSESANNPDQPIIQISPDKKYGLRTRLKPKVKTNIVKRMLKRSAQKRSLPSDVDPDTAFVTVKLKKRKIRKPGCDDPKYISVLENYENQHFGEASIFNEAGEVTVVKLSLDTLDEQSAATLSIQPVTLEDQDDLDDDEDYVDDEDDIDDLEEEDDIEDDDDEKKSNNDENDSEISEEELKTQCKNCPGLFLSESESCLHAQFHKDGSKLLHCLYCINVTGTWEQMQNHLLEHIDNNNAPGAATMLKKLRGSRAAALTCRRLRRKGLAGTESIKCSLCPSVRMATRIEEEIHQSCHREDSRLLRCPHCDHVAGNWAQMQIHLAAHPEVPVESYAVPIEERTCPKCHKVFPTSEMVVEHQFMFHVEQRKFMCEICGKVFKERKSMARHKEIHDNILYKCGECNYKTRIHQDLVDHQRIHQGLGFKCGLCDKVFVRQAQLHNHQEVHNKDQTVVICDQCGHQARGMVALRYHHRDVHGVPQSFPCSQCDYVGKTKSNLKGHTDRIHDKKFKCTHCDFACLEERTLLRHIDIYHNEGRKYRCNQCRYRARDPKCLTEHMRVIHNPNAPKVPCAFCGMEFKTKSMLRDHLPLHTGERFICLLCDYVAKYRSILYRHVMKRHPGHTLASVTKIKEPDIKETPDGKPILPTRSRGPPRRSLQSASSMSRKIEPILTSNLGQVSDEMNDLESQTTTLTIVASENEANMMDADSEMLNDHEHNVDMGGGMYIAMEEGETVDENSIVLDASLLAQAAAGGGSITLNNNMCLQIIQNNAEGEDITMQVISSIQNGGEGGDKPVELLLFASEEM